MATSSSTTLSQLLGGKFAWECIVVAVEDVSDLWPTVEDSFEARTPFKKVHLVNKDHSTVMVEKVPVEYVLTTDARLRGKISQNQEQSPFCFRHPYATVVLVSCEDLDEYKSILKPRLRSMLQNDDRDWFILFVSRAAPSDSAQRMVKKVYSKLQDDFSTKRRERCCKVDVNVADVTIWDDVESKMIECIRNTLERRMLFYEEESRKLAESRYTASWNFNHFLVIKESSACMFEMAGIYDDALREYGELEQCYYDLSAAGALKVEFGGTDPGDDRAALLETNRKPLSQFVQDDKVRDFDFRQYLFARQAMLLLMAGRPAEVASRGFPFILSFSRVLTLQEKQLPFCLKEVWVITACLALVKSMSERFVPKSLNPDAEKEFYRLRGDLFSHARTKFMRLADLIGFSVTVERSPCNSAALSMLPWPRPAVWPALSPGMEARVAEKQQPAAGKLGANRISRKPLSLAPTSLLREANRRRASVSAGNLSELLESRDASKDQAPDSVHVLTSVRSLPTISTGNDGQRSSLPNPNPFVDKPMQLPEIQVAAESALLKTVSDQRLHTALSSVEACEEYYLELTQAAADSFHLSWRERHGVVLDGEIAAVHYRRGNIDAAAKLLEKVCALYAGERWLSLLAQVLPHLSDCQLQLNDLAGYLSSCSKMLALGQGLLPDESRKSLQAELVRLAHSGLPNPVSLDVSALISFSPSGGPALELCEGDPGVMQVSVWSGFPDDILLGSLSLTLITTYSPDDGAKIVQTEETPVLKPGKQILSILLPPLRAGSYVLGALTGQIGQVKVRSHTYCTASAVSSKSGAPESDDYLIVEKPLRPVLEVTSPRALVEISAVVSWGLLLGASQWVGLITQPQDYSLKGATLCISSGPGLEIRSTVKAQLQPLGMPSKPSDEAQSVQALDPDVLASSQPSEEAQVTQLVPTEIQTVEIKDGKIEFPDWASTISSILWLQVLVRQPAEIESSAAGVQALPSPPSPKVPLGSPSFSSNRKRSGSASSGIFEARADANSKKLSNRTTNSFAGVVKEIDIRMEFGAAHSQVCERTISVQFAEPFRTAPRVVRKGNDRAFIVQVTLVSQVVATITVLAAKLKLQSGFVHVSTALPSTFEQLLPLTVTATSEGALLFVVSAETGGDREDAGRQESVLEVEYRLTGDRKFGAHTPPSEEATNASAESEKNLLFTSAFILKMPVLEQLLAVGLLPTPLEPPQLGQPVILEWRVERLKAGWATVMQGQSEGGRDTSSEQGSITDNEELLYEIKLNEENWMIAGRKEGFISLPPKAGSRVTVAMICVPLVAGHVHPPSLRLPFISRAHINPSPAGPHLICVLPPSPCTALCVAKHL